MGKLFSFASGLPAKKDVNKLVGQTLIKRQSITNNKIKITGKSKDVSAIIANIKMLYNKHLDKYSGECECITEENRLYEYIDTINKNGFYSLDTETTGLDVYDDSIVGISLYTPNEKAVYIPINHKSYITSQRVENQIKADIILDAFKTIKSRCIMFNAHFDLSVLSNMFGLDLKLYWDVMLFQKLSTNGLNISNSLKPTWARLIKNNETEVLSFDGYFDNITFDYVPVPYGYVYAAMDAKMTYDLFEYQKELINNAIENNDTEIIENYNIFKQIEMPIVRVVKNMEERGVSFDFEYCSKLESDYAARLEEILFSIQSYVETEFAGELENYRRLNLTNCKLSKPINFSSPTQMAILLYDIMGVSMVDGRKTGVDVLKKIDNDFTKMLLKYRELEKLYSTYITKMPNVVKKDGKIHTTFNSLGARTGRFSSENPNLQNIPSLNKDIRKMFIPDSGNYLFSCDYSSQEPRIVAHLSNDPVMIKAFHENYDFYSFLASNAYKMKYEECKEFYPDGTKNPEGAKVRTKAKKAFLGICYGMAAKTLSQELGITYDEAIELLDKILRACPGLKMLLEESTYMAKNYGYVTTIWGRHRYLEYIQKDKFEFNFNSNKGNIRFDPLDFDNENSFDVYEDVKSAYLRKLNNARNWKAINQIIESAKSEGVNIIDNSGYIAEDERKAINSRVQGSAADMTKLGMIELEKCEELKRLGFQLLLTVHDEVIGQGPIENKDKISALMEECMLKPTIGLAVPFKCDVEISTAWYGDVIK